MEPWEVALWESHAGTWTSTYSVRAADGKVVDEYTAVNEISIDLSANTYAQRNTYTRKDGDRESVETRAYTAFFDGQQMIISGKVRLMLALCLHVRSYIGTCCAA
jgi:hypothetical protein